jgi:alpha(1,3/1,4) fucosyltransferase
MNILRLGFTDTHQQIRDYFTELFSKRYAVILDDVNPDFLIFGDKNFGQENLKFNDKKCVKIFYTGENQRPWEYQCHYAITFDHYDMPLHYRLPLYVIYDWDNQRKGLRTAATYERNKEQLKEERGFCSFVVRNGNCQYRNQFFAKLNAYKTISAAGPLFNNTGFILPYGDEAMKSKQEYLPKFKFNMCFENSSHPGYATEKLYEALCGNTIPIYWGSPTIECDFNPKAFLNWHDYQNDDDFLEAIKRVDNDTDLYEEMYLQPMFARKNRYMDLDMFHRWFHTNVYNGNVHKELKK